MYDFAYLKPTTLEAARAALQDEDAVALAGGQTLLAALKQRLAQPETVVDLSDLPELKGINDLGDMVEIRAGARHVEVERSPIVRAKLPALADLAGKIGDPQVRNRGTLGGSIANNDPAACYPAALLALGARVVTDRREIPAERFFTGLYETALEPGELVIAARFSAPMKASWRKFSQPASRFSMVGVFLARFGTEVRVGVTGASESGAFRHSALEQALGRSFTVETVAQTPTPAEGMIGDLHGAPDYRAHLVGVMAARAVADCM